MRIFERLRKRAVPAVFESNAGVAARGEAKDERTENAAVTDDLAECSFCYPNAKQTKSRRL